MKATKSGMKIGLAAGLLVSVVLLGGVYKYILRPSDEKPESAAALTKQAETALGNVRRRDLSTTLRPARYDEVLQPLDAMLRMARQILEGESYNPITDYDRVAAYTQPVLRIALEAHEQAQTETSFLRSTFRFMQQRGDASQFLATALWNRLEALHAQASRERFVAEDFIPSPAESERLFSILNTGIESDPENKRLFHLRGVLNRVNGMFPAAERDLRRAIDLDPDYSAAWNVLGLVLISLRDFDGAERAFATAADRHLVLAQRANVPPGPEYLAAQFNLARLHQALALFFEREERTDPNPENRKELLRHRNGMETALKAILSSTDPDTPEYREARDMLAGGR